MARRRRRKSAAAWYALRRTMPPWSFEENLEEAARLLPEWGVDELILKIDSEEFSHGQPPLPWVRDYLPKAREAKARMESLGIVFSLNPWITTGHCDRGRDNRRRLPDMQFQVGHDGTECHAVACPLSPAWRRHTRTLWELYAETEPHAIWVEDDIRTWGHRPIRWGCFCPLHLAEFSRRVGETVTREDLVGAILRPGRPHPWRATWLVMQGEIMVEVAHALARAVHAISPETRMGLMSSGPRRHAMEGRQWPGFAQALADGRTLYSRPPLGNYIEGSLRGLTTTLDNILLTRHVMPPETVEQTEVENVPFSQYAKSAAFTALQMTVSFATGAQGVTMNLFDHLGNPMADHPAFGAMLAGRKRYLNGLAARAQAGASETARMRGARVPFHPRESFFRRLPEGADETALHADGREMADALVTAGIPVTYDEAETGPVFLTGQTVRALTDEAVRALLTGGTWLDGTAAAILHERGFGEEIGLRAVQPPAPIDSIDLFCAEELLHPDFGGADKRLVTASIPTLGGRPRLAVADPLPGATPLSRMVGVDAEPKHLASYAYENLLGGRVVVHLYDHATAFGPAWRSPYRTELLRRAALWLSRGELPAFVEVDGANPLPICRDVGPRTVLGLVNLSHDPYDGAVFDLAGEERRVKKIAALSPRGRWTSSKTITHSVRAGRLRITVPRAVTWDRPLFLCVTWR
jgi:hypothetical protein